MKRKIWVTSIAKNKFVKPKTWIKIDSSKKNYYTNDHQPAIL